MWQDLEKGFQAAFEAAWEAYRYGNSPIGAAVLNRVGDIVSTGKNQVNTPGNDPVSLHQLAHAEINAILKLPEEEYPDIRTYTLYTVLEPCPLCYGAVVMGSIRFIKYAASDPLGGATMLNNAIPYLINKRITIEGPFPEPEFVQRALSVSRYLGFDDERSDRVLIREKTDNPITFEAGKSLYESGVMKRFIDDNIGINEVYDYITKEFTNQKGA